MSLILDGTNGLSDVDGTAATPAIRGTDTNTGIFFPAADTIAFSEGGSEVARFDSSGNLIVGGTTALNTSSGRGNITINGSSNAILNFSAAGVDQGYIYHNGTDILFDNSKNGFIRFGTNATERMRINSSGKLSVGGTSDLGMIGAIQSGAGGYCIGTSAANNGGTFYHMNFLEGSTGRGSITSNGSSTSYNTSSDYRLKENIAPMTGALTVIQQLKPVTYNWKTNGSSGQGFIAHELQEVVPDCVIGEKDAVETYTDEDGIEQTRPVYQGIDTSFLVATLTAAIQELNAKVDAQAARIAALEGAEV